MVGRYDSLDFGPEPPRPEPQPQPVEPVVVQPEDPDAQRQEALQKFINWYTKRGYRVVSRTDYTVQLVKPKQFSFLIALLGLLFFVLGLFIYLIAYAAERDKQVYIEVIAVDNIVVTSNRRRRVVSADAID